MSVAFLKKLLADDIAAIAVDKFLGNQLLSKNGILRNCCTVAETSTGPIVAHLDRITSDNVSITFCHLHHQPYAIFECKRVGVEEGMRKGPQTIEKAKQGAYVARSVSALQKVQLAQRQGERRH